MPSVTRTYAPVGQALILRERWTRDHLSAISAVSPEGKLSFHTQEAAINPADVTAFLGHLLREVAGCTPTIWDGAAQRLHLERLPAYEPELNPGEGLWQQLKGVELRNVCCFNIPHLRRELCTAVKRVRRQPRLITSFFQGANL